MHSSQDREEVFTYNANKNFTSHNTTTIQIQEDIFTLDRALSKLQVGETLYRLKILHTSLCNE